MGFRHSNASGERIDRRMLGAWCFQNSQFGRISSTLYCTVFQTLGRHFRQARVAQAVLPPGALFCHPLPHLGFFADERPLSKADATCSQLDSFHGVLWFWTVSQISRRGRSSGGGCFVDERQGASESSQTCCKLKFFFDFRQSPFPRPPSDRKRLRLGPNPGASQTFKVPPKPLESNQYPGFGGSVR